MHETIAADMRIVEDNLRKEGCIRNVESINGAGSIIPDGGKLLRPRLVVTTARLCGYGGAKHTDCAVAVELLHNSTLFHDDVIDSATVRRGSPSINAIYGDNIAILAGDHFIAKSMNIAARSGGSEIVEILSKCLEELVFGQLREMDLDRRMECSVDEYHEVIDNKTASFVKACVLIGARVADAGEDTIELLVDIALRAGRLFQVADDVIDYLCDEEVTGKRRFQDVREGKMTLPAILLLGKCSSDERELFASKLGKKDLSNDEGLEILALMEKHGVFSAIKKDYVEQHSRLKTISEKVQENEYSNDFKELIELIVGRLYGYMK